MRRKNKIDILDMISTFKREVLENHLTSQEIYEEVQMMNFKVRPVQGDISSLDLKNSEFIKILWRLGKLDEFFQEHIKSISSKQREAFFNLFQEMYNKFQEELNTVSLKHEHPQDLPATLEMEIFKDHTSKQN